MSIVTQEHEVGIGTDFYAAHASNLVVYHRNTEDTVLLCARCASVVTRSELARMCLGVFTGLRCFGGRLFPGLRRHGFEDLRKRIGERGLQSRP